MSRFFKKAAVNIYRVMEIPTMKNQRVEN